MEDVRTKLPDYSRVPHIVSLRKKRFTRYFDGFEWNPKATTILLLMLEIILIYF